MDSTWMQEKKSSPPSSLSSPSPSSKPSHPKPKKSPKRASSAWADQVEEDAGSQQAKTQHKKQCLGQIMKWPKAKPKGKAPPAHPKPLPSTTHALPALDLDFYNHKDGDKVVVGSLVAIGDANAAQGIDAEPSPRSESDVQSCDTSCDDSHSFDSHSSVYGGDAMSCETLSDALSCDTLSYQSNDSSEGRKKKKNKKKKKRNYSAAEEGKKVFVGGVAFEDCDASLSKENETLAALRHHKFAQIFYLFGQVNRIQGHWDAGYCFVVFSKRKSAKLAIKCLSMAPVRRKVVQNLRDNVGPSGLLPLPSFYVRWANNPNTKSPTLVSAVPPLDDASSGESEDKEVEWVHAMKEEDMAEAEVERLMQDLKKLNCATA